MLHLYDRATMAHALTLSLDPALLKQLKSRIAGVDGLLLDDTEYLIIEPGDTEADIVRHVGFSPLIEPIDGKRFGEAGFHAYWDALTERDGWFELIVTFGSTFAYILLIADQDGVPAALRSLCRHFSRELNRGG